VMRRARLCAQVDGVGCMHVGRVVPPAVRSESPRSRARPAPGSLGPWRPAGRRCHPGRDPRSGGLECWWSLKEGSWRCRRVMAVGARSSCGGARAICEIHPTSARSAFEPLLFCVCLRAPRSVPTVVHFVRSIPGKARCGCVRGVACFHLWRMFNVPL
jgi:hypothetical protein